jgi:hypothetical protein
MKQLLILAALCILFGAAASANPTINDKKPAKHHKKTEDGKKDFQVLPNYKTGNATVSFTSGRSGKGTIVVLNEEGATVIKLQVQLTEGKNKIDISNFTNLEEGYYTICLNTNYKTWSAPFLLWK